MENPLEILEQNEATNTDAGEQTGKPARQLSIFISHKQDNDGNIDNIAQVIYEDLSRLGHDVYLDKMNAGGEQWVKRIKEELDKADFVIVLITAEANESEWVTLELEYANELIKAHDRPTIIPVRMNFDGQYSFRIGVCVNRFQFIAWDLSNYAEFFRKLEAAINKEPVPLPDRESIGMEGFLVSNSRKEMIREAFVGPSPLDGASGVLKREKLLWITGDEEVRNYVALCLAVKEQTDRVYEVTKSRSWSQINNTMVRNSVIIFQDAQPAAYFDEVSPKRELDNLQSLIDPERQNIIIITTSEDVFSEAEQEMRKWDFKYAARLEFKHGCYTYGIKLQILKNLLEFTRRAGDLTPKQYDLARSLLREPTETRFTGAWENLIVENRDNFHRLIERWFPADIERFVTQHLRQVKKSTDILRLLQRSADLDDEIHTWFLALDPSSAFLRSSSVSPLSSRPGGTDHSFRTGVSSMKYSL